MAGKKINAEARWVYNAYDCSATIGAFNVLYPQLNDASRMVYQAQMALEACCLAVQSKGFRVDVKARKELKVECHAKLAQVKLKIAQIAAQAVNPNSSPQTKELFYGDLGLEPQKSKSTGKIGVDNFVLSRISKGTVKLAIRLPRGTKQRHLDRCSRLANLFILYREIKKDLSMIEAKLDNGRLRTSYGVAGTKSFRFSASKTCYNTGANLQQMEKGLRTMLIPDPGMQISQGDQDRAESYVVAYCSGDPNYIQAHNEKDTHLEVAKLIWPDEGWTGDFEQDLAYAQKPGFIGKKSRRDASKATQHSLNYYPIPVSLEQYRKQDSRRAGPHHTLARDLRLSLREAKEVVIAYLEPFPGIYEWQQRVIAEVKKYKSLIYPGGFKRDFFGRPWESDTHREAISSIPQAVIAWNNHIAFFRLWKDLEVKGEFEVLHHNHDAVIVQFTEGTWEVWKPQIDRLTKIYWPGLNEEFTVPWSWDIGSNWKECS